MRGDGFYRLIRAALAAALAAMCLPPASFAKPISIRTSPVPLSSENPHERRVGRLIYAGGLSLHSPADVFGGFSGVSVSPDGSRMLAISDMGYWLQAELAYDEEGNLKDVRNARLSPMLGLGGKPITGKRLGDAEGLSVSDDGIYVSFEREHRIWRYPATEDLPGAVPTPQPAPAGLASVRRNKGLEALTRLPGGALLLLTEEGLDKEGNIRGWLGGPGALPYLPIRLRRTPPFAVTGAALLPDRTAILILERRFSRIGGLGIKLRRVAIADIRPGALLEGRKVAEFGPGHTIDNFEGIAVTGNPHGQWNVFLLSDDNFNGFQRTLLMHFRMEDTGTPSRR